MFEYYKTKKHYHTLDYYLKSKYNKKVFKIPLNASFTCPNRDGTKSTGGCAFCSASGSGDFAGNPKENLLIQYNNVKDIMNQKWKDGYCIVYFQAFSNTYGSIDKLKSCFEPFINKENVIIAKIMQEELKRYLSTTRNYKENSTKYMQRRINRPGVLLEAGFLSNKNERYLLQKRSYQDRIAMVVTKAIIKYYSK